MERETGIGGIFFTAKNPKELGAWYRDHFGVPIEVWGGAAFRWQSLENPTGIGNTIRNPFEESTSYFGRPSSQFMANFRVPDLHSLVALLPAEGCSVDEKVEESEYGQFAWVTDPVATVSNCGSRPKASEYSPHSAHTSKPHMNLGGTRSGAACNPHH